MLRLFGNIFLIVLGIVQFLAIWDGLDLWYDLHGALSFVFALLLFWIPIVGGVVGAHAAHDAWGLSWLASIFLFFGPLFFWILVYGGFIVIGLLMIRRGPRRRALPPVIDQDGNVVE